MKKFLKSTLLVVSIFLISGCSSPSPEDEKKRVDPSLENIRDLKHLNDLSSIAFEWQPLKDTKIKGLKVYRGESKDKVIKVDTIDSPYATHYVDKGLKPNTEYFYKFTTFSHDGLESLSTMFYSVRTRNALPPVSFVQVAGVLPKQVKIIFKPHNDYRVNGYIIERRTPTRPEWEELKRLEGRLNAEFIDIDLDDGKQYEYRIIGTTYEGYKTRPSGSVSSKTRKLPPMVEYLQGTTDKPKKIVLQWKRVSTNIDIVYNIYRAESLDGRYELVKKDWSKTSIIDNVKEDGVVYFYKVTAVDKYGLESPKQQIGTKGNSLAKPLAPTITYSAIEDGTAVIRWDITDKRNDTFIVLKTMNTSILKENVAKSNPMTKKEFRDKALSPGNEYHYRVVAIDEFGIESLPSQGITLEYKKSE